CGVSLLPKLHPPLQWSGVLRQIGGRSVGQPVQAVHLAFSAQADELYRLFLTRLETDGGAGGNVQPVPEGEQAVEAELFVHFKKMNMRSDLNRSISLIGYGQRYSVPTFIDDEVLFCGDAILPGYHLASSFQIRIGSCTVTSFVPSGNVASTCTSPIISGTPSIQCSFLNMWPPYSMSSATVFPSRAPSRISEINMAIASG